MKRIVAIGLIALASVAATTTYLTGYGSANQRPVHRLVNAAHRTRHRAKRHRARRSHRRRRHQRFNTTIAFGPPPAQSAPAGSGPAAAAVFPATAAAQPPPASAPGAPCPNADTPATSAPAPLINAAVQCLINQERTSRGLPPVTDNPQLDSSAQNWSNWMVTNNQFTHGNNFAGRINATGYKWQTASENVATGFNTPRDAVAGLMSSPEHCMNILDPTIRDVGTGFVTAPVASVVPQGSTWTQDFGLQMSAHAPSNNTAPMNGCPYDDTLASSPAPPGTA
jgi:uncharacterized protein YkwD